MNVLDSERAQEADARPASASASAAARSFVLSGTRSVTRSAGAALLGYVCRAKDANGKSAAGVAARPRVREARRGSDDGRRRGGRDGSTRARRSGEAGPRG